MSVEMNMTDPLGFGKMFNKDSLKEKRLKPYEAQVSLTKDKLEITNKKLDALNSVRSHVQYLGVASNALLTSFDEKTAKIQADDEQYLSVKTTRNAQVGNFDVKVEQLAKNAYSTVDPGVENKKASFVTNSNKDLKINIGLLVSNPGVDVELSIGDSLETVCNKINSELQNQNEPYRAEIISAKNVTGDDTYVLQIMSKNSGSGLVSISWKDGLGNGLTNNDAQGEDAEITFNGQKLYSSTNKFIDILPGVSLEVKKDSPNDLNVMVTESADATQNEVFKFINSINSYLSFSSQMQNKDNNMKYTEDAVLANSAILSVADSKISDIVSRKYNTGGKFTSLSDIGIGYKEQPAKDDNPAVMLLDIIDPTKFDNALTNYYDDVKKLFINNINLPGATSVTYVAYQASIALSNGQNGAVDVEIGKEVYDLNVNQKKYEEAQDALKRIQDTLESELSKLDLLSMQAGMTLMFFDELFSN